MLHCLEAFHRLSVRGRQEDKSRAAQIADDAVEHARNLEQKSTGQHAEVKYNCIPRDTPGLASAHLSAQKGTLARNWRPALQCLA